MSNNLTYMEGSGFEPEVFGTAVPMDLSDMFDTTNRTMVQENDENISFRYLGIAIGLFDIIMGTIGNSLTIIAFFKDRKLRRNVFNLFIVNLSVIDLLTASCMMPFNVAGYIYMKWPFGNDHVTCSFHAFFYFCCGYTSVVCLLAITMNRFVGIVFPDKYVTLFSSKWASVIIVLCWVIAPMFLLPFLVAAILNDQSGIPRTPTGWKDQQFLCTFVNAAGWGAYMQVVRVLFQFLPLLLMIIAYLCIWVRVHQSNKRLTQNMGSRVYRERIESAKFVERTTIIKGRDSPILTTNRSHLNEERQKMLQVVENRGSIETKISKAEFEIVDGAKSKKSCLKKLLGICKRERKTPEKEQLSRNQSLLKTSFRDNALSTYEQQRSNKEQRLMYVSVIIWLTFIILFLPSLIINLLPQRASLNPRIHMAASNITWLNSCVNPLIYIVLHKRMRNEYKKILKRCVISLFSLDLY